MLSKHLQTILFKRSTPFITVATCDSEGDPSAAPKLILKYSRGHLYLVDVPHGQTWKNAQVNPRMAISFVDLEALKSYRLKGTVRILDSDRHRKKYFKEVDKLLNKMIVNRILESTTRGQKYGNFITNVPKDFILFKVKLLEIVEYGLEDIKTRKSTKRKIELNRSNS